MEDSNFSDLDEKERLISLDQQWVMGTPLTKTDYDELIEGTMEWSQRAGTTVVDFCNTHIVTMRRTDKAFRAMTAGVDFFVPDGMPLIWLLNAAGAALKDRIYGPRFMTRFFESAGDRSTHYFLGGNEECLSSLKANLLLLNPGAKIVGSHHGYFADRNEKFVLEDIAEVDPDFVWVGLGTPKQQDWISRNRVFIKRGVIMAVGFAFDVNAGTKPDAPMWMQRLGLTWLFRIVSEPRRLLGRYVVHNTVFLWTLAKDWCAGRLYHDGECNEG